MKYECWGNVFLDIWLTTVPNRVWFFETQRIIGTEIYNPGYSIDVLYEIPSYNLRMYEQISLNIYMVYMK